MSEFKDVRKQLLHFCFLVDTELYRHVSASRQTSKPINVMEERLWEMSVSSDFEHVLES